jgi:tetratricopeptide (TPR) repeat protein
MASYQGAVGDHAAALASLTEALRLIAELGTKEGVPQLLSSGALSRAELGDLDGALADLLRARQMSEETGSRSGQSIAMVGLSALALRRGDFDEAHERAEGAYELLDLSVGRLAPHEHALVMGQRARVAVALGDLPTARKHSCLGLDLALSSDDMPLISMVIESAAEVDLLAGEPERAARLLGITAALRGLRSRPNFDVRRTVERLREALGSDGYDAAYEAGAVLNREDATAELRKVISSS